MTPTQKIKEERQKEKDIDGFAFLVITHS